MAERYLEIERNLLPVFDRVMKMRDGRCCSCKQSPCIMISHQEVVVDFARSLMDTYIDFHKIFKLTITFGTRVLIKESNLKRRTCPRCIAVDVGDYLNRHLLKLAAPANP